MKKRILFVDDDEDMRFVVGQLLKGAGYSVELHGDLQFMEEAGNYPDLYLLDRFMDGMDLFTVCRQLKAAPETRHIPVVMFSADPRIKENYIESGADGCIEKPFVIGQFLEQISSFLR